MIARRGHDGPARATVGRWMGVAALVLALTACARSAPAQCASPTVSLFLDRTIEVFRVGDFDPSDTHVHPYVFTVSVCSDVEREARLKLSVKRGMDILADGTTNPFHLNAGTRTLTNRDLTEAGDYELQDYHVNPEGEDLQDRILATGRLPEGEYCFEIELLAPDSDILLAPMARACLTVVNPLELELLRPGAPFGEELPAVITRFPQFQWMSRAKCWHFKLAQAEPGDASGEDVMEHVPVYSTTLAGPSAPPSCVGETATSASGLVSWNYPSAGEDLRRGRTYCWQIKAEVETSGGPEEIASEVYCFRRWSPEDQGAETVAAALEQILQQLQGALGPEWEGLTPTGAAWVNGEAVDPVVVQEILDGIAKGRIRIVEMKIE